MNKRIFPIIIGSLMLLTNSMFAVPAYPRWITKVQPDGTEITIRQVGDEFYHYYVNSYHEIVALNEQGYWSVISDQPSADTIAMRRARSQRQRSLSSPMKVGVANLAPRGLLLLVNFTDKAFQSSNSQAAMNDMFNGDNYTYQGAYGSAKKYFSDQSNGAYIPTFDVVGPITVNHNCSYYGANDENGNDVNVPDLIVEACRKADNLYGVNFTQYDNDNDGYIDFVYVLYAGKGEADGGDDNTIWPHSWTITSGYNTSYSLSGITFDGKILSKYACSGEQNGWTGARSGIGTFVHEFSHVLGLPDFYDTNYDINHTLDLTPEDWEVMASGNYNGDSKYPPCYSPWEKYFFGWATPNVLNNSGDFVLTTGYNDFYQLNSTHALAAWNNTSTQYFFANRQQTGWDTYLPGHGLVCWKVQYNQSAWNSNSPNNTAYAPRYTLVAASGAPTVSCTQKDPFPGSQNVRTCSVISATPLTNITENTNGTIRFHFGNTTSQITYKATQQLSISASAFDVPISSHTFSNGIGTIVFSGALTSIGSSAFAGCSSMTSVTIPNSVTSIGNSAFANCINLISITLPNSVTSIGEQAFASCTSLAFITIPNSVTSIHEWAFDNCPEVERITVETGNPVYDSRNNCNAIIETASNTLVHGCKNTIIPSTITSIGNSAFYGCTTLASINIPSSVTDISSYAFGGCTSLNSIVCQALTAPTCQSSSSCFSSIPTDIPIYVPSGSISAYQTATGWSRFTNFQGISGTNSVISYTASQQLSISASAFDVPISSHSFIDGVGTITFSRTLIGIGVNAFGECSDMTSVTIPNSVTSIGNSAFAYCTSLTSITIPASVISIHKYAFDACPEVERITVETGNPVYDSRNNCNAIIETASNTLVHGCKNTIIPSTITSIGNSAFYGCTTLASINIPSSVTDISSYAFDECAILNVVTCEATTPPSLGSYVFYNIPVDSATLYVPISSISAYQTTDQWQDFYEILPIKCQITFHDDMGEILQQDSVEYGLMPIYRGATPAKPATAQYTYIFVGWNPELIGVVSDATYTAQFDSIVNKYQITFHDDMGEILQQDSVEYGLMPIYRGATPAKPATAQYTYTFVGWDKTIATVVGAETYTARFDSIVNKYLIVFADEAGSILQQDSVEFGLLPAYNGIMPSKPATAEFTYTFAGWSPDVQTVTGDATYTATYSSTVNRYMISFINYDGATLQCSAVNYGVTPSYTGSTPAKPATAQYTYTFVGWDKTIATVVGAETYTARFDSIVNKYLIVFADEAGSILQQDSVEFGLLPAYNGIMPSKPATAEFTYTFAGWSPDVQTVTGDATYIASYSSTVNKYTITFVDEDGTILQTSDVEYGQLPTYIGATPVKAASVEYTYIFSGWIPELHSVVQNEVYVAVYDSAIHQYVLTLSVNDEDMGVVIGSGLYDYKSLVEIKAMPVSGCEFVKWSDGSTYNPYSFIIKEDMTLQAEFREIQSGLEATETTPNVQKIFRDGHLYILRNGQLYDAAGRKQE